MFPKDLKILICDDMGTMRKIIKNSLSDLGYNNTVQAKDGVEGWAKLEECVGQPDKIGMILCDWNMPSMTGIDLLKQIRGDERFADLPFIMLTAKSEEADAQEADHFGVSAYITKPFSASDLEETFKQIF